VTLQSTLTVSPPEEVNTFSVEIAFSKDVYTTSEGKLMTLRLVNSSPDTIKITKSWEDTLPGGYTFGSVLVTITDTFHNKPIPAIEVRISPPASEKTPEAIILQPGEVYGVASIDVSGVLSLGEQDSHSYRFQATYKHQNTDGWQGEIQSDPITITVN